MNYLAVMAAFAGEVWIIAATFRRLRTHSANTQWWILFTALSATGILCGLWLSFFFEYQPTTRVRLVSFPIPVDLFHFEDGQWVDFPLPLLFGRIAQCANVAAITTLAVLPVLVASLMLHRHRDKALATSGR